MNYKELIEQRYSVRNFKDDKVPQTAIDAIHKYHDESCMRLFPEIETELYITDEGVGAALETAAGYNQFLIGAPRYLVLLSEKKDTMYLNAGFIVEDLCLKLLDLGLGSVWITFSDPHKIKSALGIDSDKEVAGLLGFGYGKRANRTMRLNIISMSNVKISERNDYYNTKKSLYDIISWEIYGNHDVAETETLQEHGTVLKAAITAAANAPSYLNLQPYQFLMRKDRIHLLSVKDEFTGEIDTDLNLGIVMQHFTALARTYIKDFEWTMEDGSGLDLPEGVKAIAYYAF